MGASTKKEIQDYVAWAKEALKILPKKKSLTYKNRHHLVSAYHQLKNTKAALHELEIILKKYPHDRWDDLLGKAVLLEELGRAEEAYNIIKDCRAHAVSFKSSVDSVYERLSKLRKQK